MLGKRLLRGNHLLVCAAVVAFYIAATPQNPPRLRIRVTVGGDVAPANTVLPAITGTAESGQTLTSSTGTWTGTPTPTYTYQWRECDSGGASCSNLGGATASTYVLVSGDVGSTIRVVVTATNTAGDASATSTQTSVIAASSTTISLTPGTTYQTINAWEGVAGFTIQDLNSVTNQQITDQLDLSVTDLGITRVRMEVWSGMENPTHTGAAYIATPNFDTFTAWANARYDIVNDNGDPNSYNASGFDFSFLQYELDRIVVPWRTRVLARGETPYINLCYVDFQDSQNPSDLHRLTSSEYAEFILAMWNYMNTNYSFVPNALEVILEPDTSSWLGTNIGNAIVATAARLSAAGFATPDFIAPSTTAMANASPAFDEIIAVTGAQTLLSEISYHRYASNTSTYLGDISSRAVTYGKRTSMIEWFQNTTIDVLYEDLTLGRNSAWQHSGIIDPYENVHSWASMSGGVAYIPDKARMLRQVTKYVRPGAQRILAASTDGNLVPLAFINANGYYTVTVKAAASSGTFTIGNLPAGTYGVFYTTAASYNQVQSDQTISSGQSVSTSIPAAGVITIHRKS